MVVDRILKMEKKGSAWVGNNSVLLIKVQKSKISLIVSPEPFAGASWNWTISIILRVTTFLLTRFQNSFGHGHGA